MADQKKYQYALYSIAPTAVASLPILGGIAAGYVTGKINQSYRLSTAQETIHMINQKEKTGFKGELRKTEYNQPQYFTSQQLKDEQYLKIKNDPGLAAPGTYGNGILVFFVLGTYLKNKFDSKETVAKMEQFLDNTAGFLANAEQHSVGWVRKQLGQKPKINIPE